MEHRTISPDQTSEKIKQTKQEQKTMLGLQATWPPQEKMPIYQVLLLPSARAHKSRL